MDTSKMRDISREQFEAWAHRKAVVSGYQFLSFLLVKNEDGSYQTAWVDNAWMGWQASREAVAVELPTFEDYPASMERDMRESLRSAIELKV